MRAGGGTQRIMSFRNVTLKFWHMGTKLLSFGILVVDKVGNYALINPTVGYPRI